MRSGELAAALFGIHCPHRRQMEYEGPFTSGTAQAARTGRRLDRISVKSLKLAKSGKNKIVKNGKLQFRKSEVFEVRKRASVKDCK